jgi:beta-lactamase regulating signal transducer with metallopeptidase domain
MNTPLWFSNLLSWSVQVALLVLVATILPRLFRIRQPGVLLAYWRGLVLVSLGLPLLQPWQHLRIIHTFLVPRELAPAVLPPPSSPVVSHSQLPNAALLAWIAGVVILCGIALRAVILTSGLLKLRQFRRTSRPVPNSVERFAVPELLTSLGHPPAEFRLSADVDSPVTFGWGAPVILLPERFLSLAPELQTAIACHELLHVRRRDWVHHLVEEVLRGVFWFHPAIIWLIARVRLAREQVVDLEAVRLTRARKTYLEALLEFAAGRTRIVAIPAPPFLAERQLVERVALTLKEVRMSRARLIGSLSVIAGCLALAVVLTARTFPLKGAPLAVQAPKSGVGGGISGGVPGGVSGTVSGGVSDDVSAGVSSGIASGISGGISGDTTKAQGGSEPNVDYDSIWTDTVKRGPMVRQVRGLGTLVRKDGSDDLIARITLPVLQTRDVRANQSANVGVRGDLNSTANQRMVTGYVTGISPGGSGETQSVDIDLSSRHFAFSPGTPVTAVIDIEKISDVVQVGRPVHGAANSTVSLFKIVNNGTEAARVNVKLGRASVNTIEVLDGLKEGDKIILSDMSAYDNVQRVRLTNDTKLSNH